MKARTIARAAALAAALFGISTVETAAQTATQAAGTAPVVTLQSFDGFTQLRGKLINYDGTTYTLETVLGTIQVDAQQVNCIGEACPQNLLFGVRFGIHGSNAIGAELMPALIEGYSDTLGATLVTEVGASPFGQTLRIIHEDGREMAEIDLQARGSSLAFRSLAAGAADIGMSSRRARDGDMRDFPNAGLKDPRNTENELVIALDGLIAIVHPDNPVKSISIEELARIFSGSMVNWSEIGGPDHPISLYAGDAETGTFQTFESIVLKPHGVKIAPDAKRFVSNTRLSDAVAADRFGIGVTASAFERAARTLPIRQDCGLLSYPSSFAMKTEEYPLSRRLYLYTPRKDMTAHASQLIEFVRSDAAQPLIEEAGFVSVAVETSPITSQGERLVHALTSQNEVSLGLLREFLNEVKSGERLSTTFRFTPGGAGLEPKSQHDAERFARDIATGRYAGKEILLIGFTDSVGQFKLNRTLSAYRAEVVNQTLRKAVEAGALEDAKIIVKGYGEMMPIGCNTTPAGRSINRRVEVWIRDAR